jgi:uncharacterized protein YkwD
MVDPLSIEQVAQMQKQVNTHRQDQGCPALEWSKEVALVAQAHSEDMADHEYFSHTNGQGQTFADRVSQKGLMYQRVGENLAVGSNDVQLILQGWLDSSGHRANLENCSFTHHGIGLSRAYWTHLFFTPLATP